VAFVTDPITGTAEGNGRKEKVGGADGPSSCSVWTQKWKKKVSPSYAMGGGGGLDWDSNTFNVRLQYIRYKKVKLVDLAQKMIKWPAVVNTMIYTHSTKAGDLLTRWTTRLIT
jgi:hypothetical protein